MTLFDAKATAHAHGTDVDGANLDLTGLTIGTGSDRALVAFVSVYDVTGAPNFTLTWDPTGTPQSLTLIGSINNGDNYTYLYGLVNPASGNKTLRLTTSGTHAEIFLDAASFTEADQTGGTTTFANVATNTGTSTTISVTITSATGNMTVNSVIGPQVISSPTQTEIYSDNGGTFTSGAASYAAGAASVTHQWTLASSVDWASVGCDIVSAGGADPVLTVEGGSYTLTGSAVSLERGYPIAVGSGSYSLTGSPVSLERGYPLAVGLGTYNLTGSDVTLTYSGSTYTITVDPGNYALTGTAISLEFGHEVAVESGSYTLTGSAVSLLKGWRIEVGNSSTLNGISFPSNADAPTNDYVAIEFPNPEDDGLPIWGPANAGVTIVREVNIRQQTAEPVNGSYYYSHIFYSTADRLFDPLHYWGFHPYPQSGSPGTDPNSYFEVAAHGDDIVATIAGPGHQPLFDHWYTQGVIITKSGTSERFRFFVELPSTDDADVIDHDQSFANYGEAPTTNSLLSIGDAPWFSSYQHERFSGILGRIKIFAIALSEADMLAEAADMSQLVTAAGQANIWWGKNNFESVDDLTCDYGTGRSWQWNNAAKGTLVAINTDSIYQYHGSSVALEYGRSLAANPGVYTVSGSVVSLEHGYTLVISSGVYSLTGADVTLTYSGGEAVLAVDPGSYVLTGLAISLLHGQAIVVGPGSYTLTGLAVSLTHGYPITVDPGTYTLTGLAVSLEYNQLLAVGSGVYTVTGSPVSLERHYDIAADPGSYSLTGSDVAFGYDRALAANTGSYVLVGSAVTLSYSGLITYNNQPIIITAIPERLVIVVDSGRLTITTDLEP